MDLPPFYQVFFGSLGASPAKVALAVGLSLVLGAAHAVSPGHGKTLVVASLLGSRGSLGQALLLAVSVAVTHTAGVLLLAGIVLVLNDTLLPEQVTPWLTLIASLFVVALGVDLTRRALRAHGRPVEEHAHEHAHGHVQDDSSADLGHELHDLEEEFTHHHGDGILHRHPHAPPGAAPAPAAGPALGRGYTILVGIVGGFVPNATALVVLTMAISFGQVAIGLLLVACFGVGMALVLTGVGLAAILVRRRGGDVTLARPRLARALELLPTASGVAVLAVGLFLTFEAVGNLKLV